MKLLVRLNLIFRLRIIRSLVINTKPRAVSKDTNKLLSQPERCGCESWPQATSTCCHHLTIEALPRCKINLFYIFLNSVVSSLFRCTPFRSLRHSFVFLFHFVVFGTVQTTQRAWRILFEHWTLESNIFRALFGTSTIGKLFGKIVSCITRLQALAHTHSHTMPRNQYYYLWNCLFGMC